LSAPTETHQQTVSAGQGEGGQVHGQSISEGGTCSASAAGPVAAGAARCWPGGCGRAKHSRSGLCCASGTMRFCEAAEKEGSHPA